ncbi:MAG: hypothetical protein K2X09_03270, partial [Rickettsiales bacterium]|nr:hypothetical protein [Rickettsiales bacterium]
MPRARPLDTNIPCAFFFYALFAVLLMAFVAVGVSVYQYKNTRTQVEVALVIAPKTGTRAMLSQL